MKKIWEKIANNGLYKNISLKLITSYISNVCTDKKADRRNSSLCPPVSHSLFHLINFDAVHGTF